MKHEFINKVTLSLSMDTNEMIRQYAAYLCEKLRTEKPFVFKNVALYGVEKDRLKYKRKVPGHREGHSDRWFSFSEIKIAYEHGVKEKEQLAKVAGLSGSAQGSMKQYFMTFLNGFYEFIDNGKNLYEEEKHTINTKELCEKEIQKGKPNELLRDFSNKLRNRLRLLKDVRPFVCDGNPLECEIFIVGLNPATSMDKDFFSFWSDLYGFDKGTWFKAYLEERERKPLKDGRTRRQKVSPTRSRIDRIAEALYPIKILETNLYSVPTEHSQELSLADRKIELFRFLMETIKPPIVFFHGKEVIEVIEKLASTSLRSTDFLQINLFGVQTNAIAAKHLSIGWSMMAVDEMSQCLGKKLAQLKG